MVSKNRANERYLGCHVSSAGGLEQAIVNAEELGVNTIQIHPAPPQRWNSKPFAKGFELPFIEARKKSGVKKVFFHGVYLLNLAAPDPQHQHLSKISLVHYLDLMERIGGDGVIFHVGSMKNEENEATGYERIINAVNWIFKEAPGEARLLLEVAAGSGKIIGDRLEELARIYDGVTAKDRLGFALDSQHLWASGYDVQNELEDLVAQVERIFSIEKVGAIHLNDSKTDLGSRKDRHENLGDGLIGWEALKALTCHPKLIEIPFILETPGLKSMETAKVEVARLKEMTA